MKINWKYTLGSLLALLGFGSCEKIADIGGGLCMYGQPTAHFKFIGDVRSTDGKAVPGIRVIVHPTQDENNTWDNDTLYTNSAGHVEKDLLKYDWPDKMIRAKVTFEDVDGEANGSYKTKVLNHGDLEIKQTRKGEGAWYMGDYTVKAEAVLEKDE